MKRILGIDTSLTSTGVACIYDGALRAGGTDAVTHCLESAPVKRAKGDKTPQTIAERNTRLCELADSIVECAGHPDDCRIAVVEAPSYGSVGGSTWDRAGLWWMVVSRLMRKDVPVVIVPPKTRALWATGSGASGKAPVAVHLSRLWPDIDPGVTDDEWDALALASMGAQHLGWMPIELARHREQLAKVVWPDVPAGVAA